jgi:Flp pilus assembly protein TadD
MSALRVFRFLEVVILMSGACFAQMAEMSQPNDPAWSRREGRFSRTRHASPAPQWMEPAYVVPNRPVSAPGRATVSIHELKHQVPRKAVKEYEKALKSNGAGRWEEAVGHFRNAIDIDPEFVEAHNDLAATYLRTGKADPAIPHLEKALQLDPQSSMAYSNLTVAYLLLKQPDHAEDAARRMIEIDRVSNRARFILALTLVMGNKFTDETAALLEKSEADFPQATLLLGRTLAAKGDLAGAAARVRKYLSFGEPSGRELATEWLTTLEKSAAREQASANESPLN